MANIVSTGRTISTNEYLEKRNRMKRKKRIIVSVILLALLAALLVVSRLRKFQIENVVVTGAVATGADTVAAGVKEALSGNYLWIVPHSNALLYRKGKMKEELAKRFPRFSRIDLSLEGLKTLVIDVDEREPFALYCRSAETCWFLDREGFVFDRAPNFSEGVYFAYEISPAPEDPEGKTLFGVGEFPKIRDFISAIHSLGFEPFTLSVENEDFYLHMKSGTEIVWSKGTDVERSLNNLKAFLSSPAILAEKDFISRVRRLDLRTEDKVFYSFK